MRIIEQDMNRAIRKCLNGSRTKDWSKANTSVFLDSIGAYVNVKLWNTIIVRINQTDQTLTLNTGGWDTPTTKSRMNAVLEGLDLPLRVYQEKYVWYVWNYETQETQPYMDGMSVDIKYLGGEDEK